MLILLILIARLLIYVYIYDICINLFTSKQAAKASKRERGDEHFGIEHIGTEFELKLRERVRVRVYRPGVTVPPA